VVENCNKVNSKLPAGEFEIRAFLKMNMEKAAQRMWKLHAKETTTL
jgi:hypothetical protein